MIVKMPKAVFFDWDGTLVDSCGFLNDAHSYVRGRFGLEPFAEGEYAQKYFGKPRDILYPLIYGEDHFEQAKAWFEEYVVENRHKVKPLHGASAFLTFLHAHEIPMGAVSNKKADYLRAEAEQFGWNPFFLSYTGAGDAVADKPSPEPLYKGLRDAGLDMDMGDVWFVGDTDNDLKCAQGAGCVSILVRYGVDTTALEEEYRPDLTVESCSDLQEKLLQCVQK